MRRERPEATRTWTRSALGGLFLLLSAGLALATDTDCTDSAEDGGGYQCAVLAADTIPDISATGTRITWTSLECEGNPVGDECKLSVSLGGSFLFYESSQTSVWISSNGFVSFAEPGAEGSVDIKTIPADGAPDFAVYAYGDDFDNSTSGDIYYQSGVTCTGDRSGDTCFVVQWDSVPIVGVASSSVTAQLALDLTTHEAIVEIESETESSGERPQLIGTENPDGTAGLWYKSGVDDDSRAGSAGTRFVLTANLGSPDDVEKLTAASVSLQVTPEWANPVTPDFDGVLVLRQLGTPVTATPVDGTSYTVGQTIDGDDVVCVTTSSASSCTDATVANGSIYHFEVFSFDVDRNYAAGVTTRGFPRSATDFKWTFTTAASSLNASGVVDAPSSSQNVIGIGNDRLLHRMAEADGTSWEPPLTGGAVQSRPMVGDLDPDSDGSTDFTAFVTSQDGFVYRFDLGSAEASIDASADAITDAACASGFLQAGPVVMLDFYDGATGDTEEDTVIVATRCGASDNKILAYDHSLVLLDSYDGDESGPASATLGISNGTPAILYRSSGKNLIYVPVREDGDDNESLVVMTKKSNGTFDPPYSELTGLGDVDASPVVFRNGSGDLLAFGNDTSTVYLYDAVTLTGGSPAPLVQNDSYTPTPADGPVKGVAVSTPINVSGGQENWVVWTTDTKVHGIKVDTAGTFDSGTYWSIDSGSPTPIPGPSAPVVLRFVGGVSNTLAYVGASNGCMFEVDLTDGSISRSWEVESGTIIGDPTFDYHDGTSQGIVVGSTSGMIHWVELNTPSQPPAVTCP